MNDGMATVGSVLRTVLPRGTVYKETKLGAESEEKAEHFHDIEHWLQAPILAPDLFAATAYLGKVGGAVSYFNPSPFGANPDSCEFFIDSDQRKVADDAAKEWRVTLKLPAICVELWAELIEAWDKPINPGYYDGADGEAPPWWSATLRLAMIADMACARLFRNKITKAGWHNDIGKEEEPFEKLVKLAYDIAKEEALERNIEFRSPASLAFMADDSVVCVLPKVRVAPVGATMRNVSRNLSLLPGKGEVRCYWQNLSSKAVPSEDSETLDILLIPEPRKLSTTDFIAETNGDRTNEQMRKAKWNWDNFELVQSWIAGEENRKNFIRNCLLLLKKARQESKNVNAVVLPEYALDYEVFEQLCDTLKAEEPRLEFVISGSSSNCDDLKGNIVLTRVWDNINVPEQHITDSRRKHHRWRMNRSQVETYALSSALSPKIPNWWEKTPLGRRELHFHRFRKASVFSVLICEELARSDPCHEILRAVAPNLIFALLLDGPQIGNRWPAQYASNLADDPGSSVLTFTCYGLIDRSNQQGKFPPNHSVAMWKDDTGKIVEIPMPSGKGPRGVLLSLWPEHVQDITITGKRSEERSWRYASHFPIKIGDD